MTDAFLDDHTTINLLRDLRGIARNLPEVVRIARRETSPPGGKFARNPNVPNSRPPMNIAALDLFNDVTIALHGWTRCLAEDAGVTPPERDDATTLAIHLARHARQIAQQTWAADAADEIRGHGRTIGRFVDPPEAKYIGPCQAEGKPQCRGLFSGDGRDRGCGTCGAEFDVYAVKAATDERKHIGYRDVNDTPMGVALTLRDLGIKVTNKKITYWANRGLIVKRGESTRGSRTYPLYNLGEVEDAFYRMGGERPDQRVE